MHKCQFMRQQPIIPKRIIWGVPLAKNATQDMIGHSIIGTNPKSINLKLTILDVPSCREVVSDILACPFNPSLSDLHIAL